MISWYYFLYLCMDFLTLLWNSYQFSLHHYKLKFIIINSYDNFKLIEFSPQLNPVESLITHCSSDPSVSCQYFLVAALHSNECKCFLNSLPGTRKYAKQSITFCRTIQRNKFLIFPDHLYYLYGHIRSNFKSLYPFLNLHLDINQKFLCQLGLYTGSWILVGDTYPQLQTILTKDGMQSGYVWNNKDS